jgi:ubiquinone/menaquinone biosynthesis C-methylase UbiE
MRTYPHELVLRVNELHHDIEGHEEYGDIHDEIFVLEPRRWRHVVETELTNFFANDSKVVLDVGSGTGFVPRTLAPFARSSDTIVCSDISEGMLLECRKNIEEDNLPCAFAYKKYDGVRLPAADASVDLLTLNSVLHHIPDTEFFLKEVDRVVKPGGYVIIGHEPNSSFYKNKIIWTLYRALYLLYHPKAIVETFSRRGIHLQSTATGAHQQKDEGAEKINAKLKSEGLLEQSLTRGQINAIVDYWSINGFDVKALEKNLPHFKLQYLETYNHLYWIFMEHHKNPVIKFMDTALKHLFPKDGKTMLLVFRKSN